jgi:hypothetical protein
MVEAELNLRISCRRPVTLRLNLKPPGYRQPREWSSDRLEMRMFGPWGQLSILGREWRAKKDRARLGRTSYYPTAQRSPFDFILGAVFSPWRPGTGEIPREHAERQRLRELLG